MGEAAESDPDRVGKNVGTAFDLGTANLVANYHRSHCLKGGEFDGGHLNQVGTIVRSQTAPPLYILQDSVGERRRGR